MALQSVLDQTLAPDEVVIVADGEITKPLESVINAFGTNAVEHGISVKLVILERNYGHGIARMNGVLNCQHEYIALIDADDINCKSRFRTQHDLLEHRPDIAVCGGNIVEVDADSGILVAKKIMQHGFVDNRYIGLRCPLNQMTVMMRKSAIIDAGNYQDFYNNEDYFLWLRLYLKSYGLYNIDETLVYARVSGSFYRRRGGLKYFLSEARMQSLLLQNKIIDPFKFSFNLFVRFVVQVIFPNFIRGIVFRVFFRR
jgi:glycosyltransferase involved in cell wall biosynthesis